MQLTGFQVFNYRNIIDSGWVDVACVAATVGQNECGKSNLLQALEKFSSFEGNEYDIEKDWPIDKWPEKSHGEDTVVCEATFLLSSDDIKSLYLHAMPPPAEEIEESAPDEDSDSNAPSEEAEIDLPGTFEVKSVLLRP